MPDDLVALIDPEAEKTGSTRADWIRQACVQVLTEAAPSEHRPDPTETADLRAKAVYQEQTITDLKADRDYLRGEVTRLVQENTLLVDRLIPKLPAGEAGGWWARIRQRLGRA